MRGRLLIAGTNSGCGKTTVTCALLATLAARGACVTAFKCGPDYIDPMYHREITGKPVYNLDPFFMDGAMLRAHMSEKAGEGDIAVIEGAMGYYDGIASTTDASAFTVAEETFTPVALVLDARGAAASLGAVIVGFLRYKESSRIEGVIFNNADERRYPALSKIAQNAGVRAYGYLRPDSGWKLPSRYMGLLPAGEVANLKAMTAQLGASAEKTLDVDGLMELASCAGRNARAPDRSRLEIKRNNSRVASYTKQAIRLAVARDEAFCFHYRENIDLLTNHGFEPVFFSPTRDGEIPADVKGLCLGGGYPELYKDGLSKNISMRNSIRRAVTAGLPTIAVGGGFMYLHAAIDGAPMCGVIAGNAYNTGALRRFGYITLTASHDNILCKKGDVIRAREFHYWDSQNPGDSFIANKATGLSGGNRSEYSCIHASDRIFAGFPHLYFPSCPGLVASFSDACKSF